MIGLVAGQEIEKQARLIECPAAPRIALEDFAEQFLGAAPIEEMLLIRRPFIGIARRHRYAVDPDLHDVVEEAGDALRVGSIEQGRVDVDPKSARLCQLDRRDGTVINPALAHRAVVVLAIAVEVDRPGKIGARLEQFDLLFEQQRIRAQIDELLLGDHAPGDLVDLTVQQGFATRDDDHWRAAFFRRLDTLVDAEALIEDCVRVIDLAATGAGEVAAEQRLEHQDQRIAPDALEVLSDNVGADPNRLAQRNWHGETSSPELEREPTSAGDVGELRRHPETDVLGNAGQHRKLDLRQLAQPADHLLDKFCRSRSTGGDANSCGVLDPARVECTSIFDQIARYPAFGRDLAQPIRFELFGAPTTRTTSTIVASSRAALWRFCVA